MKPVVVYTRPRDWKEGGYGSEKLDLVYVPISGAVPHKRNGRPAGDGIGDVVTKAGVKELLTAIQAKKPAVFFHSIHAKVTRPLLGKIRQISPATKIVVMDGNNPDDVSHYVRNHREFVDAVLLNSRDPVVKKKYILAGFKDHQVGTLHDGFSPREHVPSKKEPEFDVFFAGSNLVDPHTHKHVYPNGRFRLQMMSLCAERFKAAIHGYRAEWPFIVRPHLAHPHYFPAFQTAKIVLNVNHLDLYRYYTRRTMHSGASGRMYLLKYIPGMEKDFENHVHLVWIKKVDEALEQIERYRSDSEARKKIAVAGRELFLARHTWQARLREFEVFVSKLL